MWKGCSIKRCICISYSNPIHPKCANIPQKTKFNRFHYKWTCEFCLQRSCHSHYYNISKKLISVWLQHKVTLVWELGRTVSGKTTRTTLIYQPMSSQQAIDDIHVWYRSSKYQDIIRKNDLTLWALISQHGQTHPNSWSANRHRILNPKPTQSKADPNKLNKHVNTTAQRLTKTTVNSPNKLIYQIPVTHHMKSTMVAFNI